MPAKVNIPADSAGTNGSGAGAPASSGSGSSAGVVTSTPAGPKLASSRPHRVRRTFDVVARGGIALCGWLAIAILLGIAIFLAQGAMRAISEVGIGAMISGTDWFPTSTPPKFGFLPAEVGSIWITLVGLLVCVPLGVATAVYLSEFASPRVKDIGKSIIEFMAAIPSVVLGLIGLALVVQNVKNIFGLDSGLTGFSAGLVVGILCLPTIISISEDALSAVPREVRHGSIALGNTRWQTVWRVVLPSAASGIFAAVILGFGRALGETMVVLMLAGNSGLIPDTPFMAMRSLTGTIAGEAGEVVRGGLHFSALFAMGLVLFASTFVLNVIADSVLERQRKRWNR